MSEVPFEEWLSLSRHLNFKFQIKRKLISMVNFTCCLLANNVRLSSSVQITGKLSVHALYNQFACFKCENHFYYFQNLTRKKVNGKIYSGSQLLYRRVDGVCRVMAREHTHFQLHLRLESLDYSTLELRQVLPGCHLIAD